LLNELPSSIGIVLPLFFPLQCCYIHCCFLKILLCQFHCWQIVMSSIECCFSGTWSFHRYLPGGSLGIKVGTHVRKWVSKLDPFQDLTFEREKNPFQDENAPNHTLFWLKFVWGTLFRTTNAENDPLMLNCNDFHIPKQDTRVSCPMSKTDPFSPDVAVAL
jgi:hypothetical protein